MEAETETVTEIETTEMRVRASGGYVPFDEEEDGDDSGAGRRHKCWGRRSRRRSRRSRTAMRA